MIHDHRVIAACTPRQHARDPFTGVCFVLFDILRGRSRCRDAGPASPLLPPDPQVLEAALDAVGQLESAPPQAEHARPQDFEKLLAQGCKQASEPADSDPDRPQGRPGRDAGRAQRADGEDHAIQQQGSPHADEEALARGQLEPQGTGRKLAKTPSERAVQQRRQRRYGHQQDRGSDPEAGCQARDAETQDQSRAEDAHRPDDDDGSDAEGSEQQRGGTGTEEAGAIAHRTGFEDRVSDREGGERQTHQQRQTQQADSDALLENARRTFVPPAVLPPPRARGSPSHGHNWWVSRPSPPPGWAASVG